MYRISAATSLLGVAGFALLFVSIWRNARKNLNELDYGGQKREEARL